jgi:Predicted S-adenosylmethionine-dependent methyltransferase involved in cell envelope biogenesis
MVDLTELEKRFLSAHIKPGGVAVDFTMGNGNDTRWLSDAVGPSGHVYAFDIQPQALESTRALLTASGCADNYSLILDSHANVRDYVSGPICAGVFNLGYLPRSDKKITTMRPSTLTAVTAAIELLDRDGIVLIAIYPGHAEGEAEGLMLDEELAKYSRYMYTVSKFRIINSPTSPYFFCVESKA